MLVIPLSSKVTLSYTWQRVYNKRRTVAIYVISDNAIAAL
jgi:hypothetical protein